MVAQETDTDLGSDVLSELESEVRVVVDRWSMGQVGWPDLLLSAGVVLGAAVAGYFARRLIKRATRDWEGPAAAAAAMIGQLVSVGIYLFAVALVLEILGFSLGPVLIVVLVVAVILVLLRPIVENLSSGLVLQLRGSCRPGDVMEIDDVIGVVDEVNTRAVVLVTGDGLTVHIPNNVVIGEKLTNYSKVGRRRSGLVLRLPGSTDVEGFAARVSEALAGVDGLLREPGPRVVVTGFDGAQLWVEVRFWHLPEFEAESIALDEVGRAMVDLFEVTEFAPADAATVVRSVGGSGLSEA